jgi:hypothetical protein
MSIIQRFPRLPFALTTLCVALSGCGGGSNTIIENPVANPDSDVLTGCSGANCVDVILDETPIDGLDYICASVRGITTQQGLARCPLDSRVTYYLKSSGSNKRITLGTTPKLLGKMGSQTAIRFSLLDLTNTSNIEMSSIDDNQAKAAVNIARLLYSINDYAYNNTAPINRIVIGVGDKRKNQLGTKDQIDKITSNVTVEDFSSDAYIAKVQPFLTAAKKTLITVDEAKKRVNKTIMQLNAGLLHHDPETGILLGQVITGSTSPTRPFATLASYHGTSRSGHSFGFGMEWVGDFSTTADKYIVYVRNNFNKTSYASGGINPYTHRLNDLTYLVNDGDYQGNQIKFSGKLLRDSTIIYTSDQYKELLGKDVTVNTQDFGSWVQIGSTEAFKGDAYFFKTNQVNTFLDSDVWKVAENVIVGKQYYFPLYAQIVIKNTKEYVDACKLLPNSPQCPEQQTVNIAILENGDIISDDAADGVSPSCAASLENVDTTDVNKVKQQMLGTIKNATQYTENNKVILPVIVLSGDRYKARNLDGMIFGAQSISGIFRINIAGLDKKLAISAHITDIPDNIGEPIWFNSYNYFTSQLVAKAAKDEEAGNTASLKIEPVQKANALNVKNTFQVNVSPCYKYPEKLPPIVD